MKIKKFNTEFINKINKLEDELYKKHNLEFINFRGRFDLYEDDISIIPVISLSKDTLNDLQQEPAFLDDINYYANLLLILNKQVDNSPIYDSIKDIKIKSGLKSLACYPNHEKPTKHINTPLTYYATLLNNLDKYETGVLGFGAFLDFSSTGNMLVKKDLDYLPRIYEHARISSGLNRVYAGFSIFDANSEKVDIHFDPIHDYTIIREKELLVDLTGSDPKLIDLSSVYKKNITSKEFMYEVRNQYYY